MVAYSEHFSYGKLLRFSLSSVVMMVFTSIYGVVDGLFLSNFAGKSAFAAVNFILPYLMMFSCVGFMFGTGGSAVIAKTMGEGELKQANRIFSALFRNSFLFGLLLGVLSFAFLRPVGVLLGAEGQLLSDCILYGRIYILGLPACVVQYEFQNLYVTAGKPKLGLFATVLSGVSNILLDALFVAGFSWGLAGAAAATVLSQWLGGLIPFFYFARKNSSALCLEPHAGFMGRIMGRICLNGLSELVSNISISLVSLLYNVQLLSYAGNDGVASYGILMYVNFLFNAIFWGYLVGVSPIISFQYGAGNRKELRSLLRKSMVIISACSVLMFAAAEIFALPVSRLFAGYDPILLKMTTRGFFLSSFAFLFSGIAIFSSAFFTALNNGLLSALISFLRVFAFQVPAILLLPLVLDLDGIWLSLVAAELLTFILGSVLILARKKAYGY